MTTLGVNQYDFQNPDLPLIERVRDLIGRLTLEEKMGLMKHDADAVPRFGIPAYNYWGEALHGVARNGRATVFPQAIGMAASWDAALIERIASAIADEGRAKYHEALRRKGRTDLYQGLTFWSPNINIFRDPRWGRGQETWGEDPVLTGRLGSAFVRGLQGDHPVYMKAAACAKHYAVHSGPEGERHNFNAVVSQKDLHETYLPAFKALVDAGVESVMGAYNRTNGEACCASKTLLEDILRQEWGFQGHVVSDCWALADIHLHHKLTRDAPESAALALKNGCDLACGTIYEATYFLTAIERGLIDQSDLDRALERTLSTRFKLGLFDPPERVPYADTPMSVVGCEAHRDLARQAARESLVLLKNDGVLPLRDLQSLFVTGPTAATTDVLLGNYYGISDSLTTILEGIAGRVPEGVRLEYRQGTGILDANRNPINYALTEAANAEVSVVCVGLNPSLEGEEGESILSDVSGDRRDIALPKAQADYVRALAESGTKVVLVLTGGSAIALDGLEDIVSAILLVWYPGQEGGRAVAEALFGDINPSGKLPISFPVALAQLPPFEDYAMAGRTYRYALERTLFPFGYGLSYTQFTYSQLELARDTVAGGESLALSVTVTNAGDRAGTEVTQVYLSDLEASVNVPLYSLVAFERISLEPGQSHRLEILLEPKAMQLVNAMGQRVLEPGRFTVRVGGASPNPRTELLQASFTVT